MTCKTCQASRVAPTHSSHSLGCIYCGARSLQKIKAYRLNPETKQARLSRVLTLWVAAGHVEAEIRRLAKAGALALEPAESNKK